MSRPLGKGSELGARVLLQPDAERREALGVRRRLRHCPANVARADDHVMPQFHQFSGKGLTDHAGAKNADFHKRVLLDCQC